mmetsp:Transcript_34896/g.39573  ORF Transcript_34896/g.39573 Transcript_34896/m.39573 type:complete len:253 (-) Transcript_34896:1345-2103(-)
MKNKRVKTEELLSLFLGRLGFFRLVVRVFLQNNEVLQNRRNRQIFVSCQLCSVAERKQDRGVVSLEACDTFGVTGLSDNIDCGSDTNRNGNRFQFFVYSYQHSGVHGGGQEVQRVVISTQNCFVKIEHRMQNGEETSKTNIIQQESITMEWLQGDQTFTHMDKPLCNSNQKEVIGILLVVRSQLSQEPGKTGVVSSCAYDSHRKDGGLGDVVGGIMTQLGNEVNNSDLRVGDIHQCQGQRNCHLDIFFSILE